MISKPDLRQTSLWPISLHQMLPHLFPAKTAVSRATKQRLRKIVTYAGKYAGSQLAELEDLEHRDLDEVISQGCRGWHPGQTKLQIQRLKKRKAEPVRMK